MSNPVKYDTTNVTSNLPVLVSGKWWVGTASDFPYYNMSPEIWSSYNKVASGDPYSYVIFINKASQGPSMYAPSTSSDMISLSNKLTNNSASTEGAAIANLLNNTSCFIIDRNYPNITWELLSLFYDMSYIPSYPRVGVNIFDMNQNVSQLNGTLNNTPAFNSGSAASYGYHLSFNGTSSQSISFSTITPGNGNWTVMMVVRFTAFDSPSSYGTLLTNSSGGPVTSAFGSKFGAISYDFYNGSWNTAIGNSPFVGNNWYYLTWVNSSASGGTMQMYVNGELDTTSPFSSTTSNGGPVNIIGINNWASKQFGGDIGAVYYYTKSLSNEEILRNFFGGPIVASLTQGELYPVFAYDVSIRSSDIAGSDISSLIGTLGVGRGYMTMIGSSFDTTYDFGGVIDLRPAKLYINSATGYGWSYNMTMCFWMKYKGSANLTYFLTDQDASSSRISSSILAGGIFKFEVTYNFGANQANCKTTTNVCDGAWHHVVCVWSNGSDGINNRAAGIYVYVDGVQEGFTGFSSSETSLGVLYLAGSGSTAGLGNAEHNCYIGPFQLYSGVAFNNEQVLKNYYAHIFRFKN